MSLLKHIRDLTNASFVSASSQHHEAVTFYEYRYVILNFNVNDRPVVLSKKFKERERERLNN